MNESRNISSAHATVIDVRKRSEFAEGHLRAATNIPLAELVARMAVIPRDHPVIVHCQGGTRSAIAASVMRAHRVKSVTNLEGGYDAWYASGLPTES